MTYIGSLGGSRAHRNHTAMKQNTEPKYWVVGASWGGTDLQDEAFVTKAFGCLDGRTAHRKIRRHRLRPATALPSSGFLAKVRRGLGLCTSGLPSIGLPQTLTVSSASQRMLQVSSRALSQVRPIIEAVD